MHPTYKWEPRPVPENTTDRSVNHIPGYLPALATEIPEIQELCKRRGNYNLPYPNPNSGICSHDYKDTYESGVLLIQQSIEMKQPIIVALDYDCDGQTAGACMIYVLQALGANVTWVVPNRLEQGYGLNVDLIKATGIQNALIVTVDNGITCVDEVAELKRLGHMVVITDHHLQEGDVPEADAVVNPKITQQIYDTEYMVPGVYVAAKTALWVAEKYTTPEQYQKLVAFCCPLVALGIVSDVIELNDLIRDELRKGIAELILTKHLGLKCLLDICNTKENQDITSDYLAFSVVPKLNAAGRMGTAEKGVNLLLATGEKGKKDRTEVMLLANALQHLNSDRKIIEQEIYEEALDQIPTLEAKYKNTLVIYKEGWHSGVLGIIAARIAEVYNKPTIVLTKTAAGIEGSGRSVEGFDLFTALQDCKDVMTSYGGHMVAVGVHLTEDQLKPFRAKFDEVTTKIGLPTEVTKYIDVDVTIPLLCNLEWQLFLKTFEPHGPNNPEFIFRLRNVEVFSIDRTSTLLTAVASDRDGWMIQCSKYRGPEEWLKFKDKLVDILLTPTPVFFSGLTDVKYQIVDIKEVVSLGADDELDRRTTA